MPITQLPVLTRPLVVVPVGTGLQGRPGAGAAISTDPDNRLTRGTDEGLLVPEIVSDPLAYYILAKA
jgi:hypothetical protein